jgi:hypothetical protein
MVLGPGRAVLVVVALVAIAPATAKSAELDSWFEQDLVPHVVDQLGNHPRFKGETLLFVVFENEQPASVSNALALSLRDRLLDTASDVPGVRIAWQQRRSTTSCRRDQPHYLVGVDMTATLDGGVVVRVRAFDVADGTWVNGFAKTWRGTLSRRQLADYRKRREDAAFLGSRDVPYAADQSDLVAAHLSRELACNVHRSLSDEYIVGLDTPTADVDVLGNTVALATRNLDASDAVVISADADAINARIDGKAHSIDGALHQYWLTIAPLESDTRLDSLSASVYVRLGGAPTNSVASAPAVVPDPIAMRGPVVQPASVSGVVMPGSQQRRLLPSLSVYPPARGDACRFGNCTVLSARAGDDVIVFALVHSGQRGLLRLANDRCDARSTARVVTRGHSALVTAPGGGVAAPAGRSGRWPIEPLGTAYYAIAVDNAVEARELAALIDELPESCGGSLGQGKSGLALQQWLERLSHLMLRFGPRVEWRALEARHVS